MLQGLRRLAAAPVVVAVVLSACGGDQDIPAPSTPRPAAPSATVTQEPTQPPAFSIPEAAQSPPPSAPAPTEVPTSPTPQVPLGTAVPLAIVNATIIDGTGAAPISGGTVVIRGDRISAVGPASEVAVPADARVIDAGGGTAMPGIINAHVHSSFSPFLRGLVFLTKGVTSVCNVGAPLDKMAQLGQERDGRGSPAARGFRAGPILTAPGGYPGPVSGLSHAYEVKDPNEARSAVADLVDRGADVIKIALETGSGDNRWPVLSLEQVRAIVSEAHARGRLVRAHLQQNEMLDRAIQGGVDVIDHVPFPPLSDAEFVRAFEGGIKLLPLAPELEAQLAEAVGRGMVLVPTLDVMTRPMRALRTGVPAEGQDPIGFVLQVVGRYRSLGGVVALGNDYPGSGIESGMPIREMELLLEAGLTPMEVIEAGTRHAAEACGHGDELGTLEPGRLADVIVVDGDPLTDIGAMGRVSTVVIGGEVVRSPSGVPGR